MLRNFATDLMTVGQLTKIKLKIKLVLTWKGTGPRVPGCGERFPGLNGAGAGAKVDAGARDGAGVKFDAGPTGALANAAEIVPAGT